VIAVAGSHLIQQDYLGFKLPIGSSKIKRHYHTEVNLKLVLPIFPEDSIRIGHILQLQMMVISIE
jgi:hypothetical protein